jgi:hypothetical protein
MNASEGNAIRPSINRDSELEQELSRVVDRVQRKARLQDLHAAMQERRISEFQSVGYAFGGA